MAAASRGAESEREREREREIAPVAAASRGSTDISSAHLRIGAMSS